MRGFLVMEVAGLFGVATACAARVAASVEMLHAYSLVHDDLPAMDDDDVRRGKPSTHKRFDEATAILAGDALQSRAFEVLAEADTHSDPLARCELVAALGLASGARGMAGGQMIDMATEGQALTAAEVGRLQALKTGRLIQYSAEAGAILGRAAPQVRAQIAAYGRDLGAAFQIADDVLDAVGTTEGIGKTAGKDEAAGKATLVGAAGRGPRARPGRDAGRPGGPSTSTSSAPEADRLRALAAFVVARQTERSPCPPGPERDGLTPGEGIPAPSLPKRRADQALVDLGLVESRTRAQALILAGKVWSGDPAWTRRATLLPRAPRSRCAGQDHPWASRGGLKLDHALQHFGLSPAGLVCLDVGASTGGFTSVLLHHGAARVYAVDVGHGQLAWALRTDPRVVVHERVNARYLSAGTGARSRCRPWSATPASSGCEPCCPRRSRSAPRAPGRSR